MENTIKPSQYHKIFHVEMDAIQKGGIEVILSCERPREGGRNLVTLSSKDIQRAEKNVTERKGPFIAAEQELLDLVKQLNITPDSNKSLGEPHNFNSGLDIKVLNDSNRKSSSQILNNTSLFDLGKDKRVTYITTSATRRMELLRQGLYVEQPSSLIVDANIVNKGIIEGDEDLLGELMQNQGRIPLERAVEYFGENQLFPNTFVRFDSENHLVAKVTGDLVRSGEKISRIKDPRLQMLDQAEMGVRRKTGYFGIKPRDVEQYLALHEVLLNDDVNIAFITGEQGSGKTLLTYIAAVWQLLDFGEQHAKDQIVVGTEREKNHPPKRKDLQGFKKMVLYKSNDVMGGDRRDTGFLPGSLFEKLRPFLQSYEDCHNETDLGQKFPFIDMFRHPRYSLPDFPDKREFNGKIEGGKLPQGNAAIDFRYSGHARGVTLSDSLIIIDEAQNFTPYEVKTLCERVGRGSKMIIMGDPLQCDAVGHTSPEINGFTAAIRHYLPSPYSALVRMESNYRHQISDDARKWRGASN